MAKHLLYGWFYLVAAALIIIGTAVAFPVVVSLDSTEAAIIGLCIALFMVLPILVFVGVQAAMHLHKAFQLFIKQKEIK